MLSFILGLLKRFFENEFLQLVFSKVTGLFAAILTITWAVYEYRASKHETRVERTLSYIESWHANGVREHYSLLDELQRTSYPLDIVRRQSTGGCYAEHVGCPACLLIPDGETC